MVLYDEIEYPAELRSIDSNAGVQVNARVYTLATTSTSYTPPIFANLAINATRQLPEDIGNHQWQFWQPFGEPLTYQCLISPTSIYSCNLRKVFLVLRYL